MEFIATNIIILILSLSFAIFIGRKIHPFFFPDRKRLFDSYKAGVRVKTNVGSFYDKKDDLFESMKGSAFLGIVLISWLSSFLGLHYVLS